MFQRKNAGSMVSGALQLQWTSLRERGRIDAKALLTDERSEGGEWYGMG